MPLPIHHYLRHPPVSFDRVPSPSHSRPKPANLVVKNPWQGPLVPLLHLERPLPHIMPHLWASGVLCYPCIQTPPAPALDRDTPLPPLRQPIRVGAPSLQEPRTGFWNDSLVEKTT